MNRLTALAACLVGSLSTGALAQSLGAPAGLAPATAPGGTEGLAGPRNEAEAIRSGDAIPVPPGGSGVAPEPSAPAPTMPPEPPMVPATPPARP
ncbi:MAG TPA: hypothetical protein VF641_05125 [Methylobacterium sp.]|jgi:hypothetical protein